MGGEGGAQGLEVGISELGRLGEHAGMQHRGICQEVFGRGRGHEGASEESPCLRRLLAY